jgi:hypothetical protein
MLDPQQAKSGTRRFRGPQSGGGIEADGRDGGGTAPDTDKRDRPARRTMLATEGTPPVTPAVLHAVKPDDGGSSGFICPATLGAVFFSIERLLGLDLLHSELRRDARPSPTPWCNLILLDNPHGHLARGNRFRIDPGRVNPLGSPNDREESPLRLSREHLNERKGWSRWI